MGKAHEVLRAWSKVRRLDTDLVFPGVQSFHHRWWEALERAKIGDFKFHDLRHTAASHLAMNGATLAEIGLRSGHERARGGRTRGRRPLDRGGPRAAGSARVKTASRLRVAQTYSLA